MTEPEPSTAPVNALVYLRVSTARQATKNGEAEGYSIPAQREACLRKARELGADVVDEFVDAGASARSADRAELQRLLERVKAGDITYVIVHKLDRLSRSRIDDAQISLAFQVAGTTLVSTSEQIDDTPSGSLLHGIMATIAEHYSKNLSYEAKKGMAEKVKRGGTNGVAPLGYLNETRRIDGVEIRTVVFDEDRAKHVRWAYEQYATEDWSISRLRDALEERGFKSRTTRKIVGKPLNASQVHRMLTNPYYKGQLLFKGVIYPGAHEPLVDEVLWQRVQDILGKRRIAGDRSWRHTHYLKGSLKCGRCGAGLGYMTANGNGGTYEYFYCLAQYGKRNDCDLPHLPVYEAEEAIERQWATVRFTDEQITAFSERARADLRRSAESGSRLITDQRRRLAELERQRQKLLDAYMAEALPMEVLKKRQTALTAEISNAKRLMQNAQMSSDQMFSRLEQVISLLSNAERLYTTVGDDARQILNTAVFEPFVVDLPADGDTAALIAQAPLSPVAGAVLAPLGVQQKPTKRTPTGLNTGEGSILTHLVLQLTQGWNQSVWEPVGRLVDKGMPVAPHGDRTRPVRRYQPRRQRRLSPEEMDQVIADYLSGLSARACARTYDIDTHTVLSNLTKRGIAIRPRKGPRLAGEALQRARDLRAQGWSYEAISDEFGVCHTTARTALLRTGNSPT